MDSSHKPCQDRILQLEGELARERQKREAQHRNNVRLAESNRALRGKLAIARIDRTYDLA